MSSAPANRSPTTSPRGTPTKDQLHRLYLAKLEVPTPEKIASISQLQEEKERAIDERYRPGNDVTEAEDNSEKARSDPAAGTTQDTIRKRREGRRSKELNLDPSTRWTEALKEAQYRTLISPHPHQSIEISSANPSDTQPPTRTSSEARRNWHRINQITQHARGDSASTSSSESSSDSSSSADSLTRAEHHHLFHRRPEPAKPWKGKLLDLGYFLELVDIKHRYGSNLKVYHAEWKKSSTPENFFYWLDYGEGKELDLPGCSRAVLEKEQVRYLSREERLNYLVEVKRGKLVWVKSRGFVDTSEEWKDSVQGIISKNGQPSSIESAKLHEQDMIQLAEAQEQQEEEEEASKRYPDPAGMQQAKGFRKLFHVTPATIMNHLMRSSIKKNTWIFVFSTAYQLYVSLKAPGTFQHSSFLHGSRILAAGLLTVTNGQLTSLSPLSGHYRPPSAAFRHFFHWLKEQGVDMSKVHVSNSYSVLVGLEAFVGTKAAVEGGMERVFKPEKAKMKQAERTREYEWVIERENKKRNSATMGLQGLSQALKGVAKAADLGAGEDNMGLEEIGTTAQRDEGPQGAVPNSQPSPNLVNLCTDETETGLHTEINDDARGTPSAARPLVKSDEYALGTSTAQLETVHEIETG